MYDEQTAKKGSDEVIIMLVMYIKNNLPSEILELLVHCDGYTGQAWNNILQLFFEDFFMLTQVSKSIMQYQNIVVLIDSNKVYFYFYLTTKKYVKNSLPAWRQ